VPARATDGNTNGNWHAGSVTHTANEVGAWWEVDLGGTMSIERIDVWTRTDCCSGRLKNYFVLISDSPHPLPGDLGITELFEAPRAGSPTSIAVTAQGRYVRILMDHLSALSLAEVEVWGHGQPIPLTDFSTGRPVSQSSVKHGGAAVRAVDGDTNGEWLGGSVTHTANESSAWWEVDLGAQLQIELIEMWNRTDCCGGRLRNYWILLSDSPNPQIGGPGVTQHFENSRSDTPTLVPFLTTARYVRIQKVEFGPLSLAEVRVLGQGAPPVLTNGALGRPTTQSSTFGGAVSSRAVDGDTDGNFANGSVSHTTNQIDSRWQVDLGADQQIELVNVWNRTDCCGSRLSNYYILVSSTPNPQVGTATFERFESAPAGSPTAIGVGAVGRYVVVQKVGQGPLALAEVEVLIQ